MTKTQIAAALREFAAEFAKEAHTPDYLFEYEPGQLSYVLEQAAKELEK